MILEVLLAELHVLFVCLPICFICVDPEWMHNVLIVQTDCGDGVMVRSEAWVDEQWFCQMRVSSVPKSQPGWV